MSDTTTYIVSSALAGLYLPNECEPFEATLDEAISAFLDEADFQIGDEADEDDHDVAMDRAFVESLRGHEGRGDIAHNLNTYGQASIMLESPANGFGWTVTLAKAE